MNVFCLPFAGGAGYSYDLFKKNSPDYLKLLSIELPGRGNRILEPLLKDVHLMVDDIWDQISDNLQNPYIIYGHSMGSILSYLLVRRIIKEGKQTPEHIFLSGCRPPSTIEAMKKRHVLSEREFYDELKEIGGMPEMILEDKELLKFFTPVLRADFEAIEKYKYIKETPFDIPITVMLGSEEKKAWELIDQWKNITTGTLEVLKMEGGHFFIYDHYKTILRVMSNKVALNSF